MQDKRNIENVVQEIMGLVNSYAHVKMNQQTFTNFAAKSISEKIESKLRELVENSFSVREALDTHEVGLLVETAAYLSTEHQRRADFINGIRYAELAHNITKDS